MKIRAKDISTAPKDGTVILTDAGSVCYVDQSGWGSPVTEGWWLCEPGSQPQMPEDGYPVAPKIWAPYPELILPETRKKSTFSLPSRLRKLS